MDTEGVKPGLRERLGEIIGTQAPHSWARDVGIGKSTFDGIWNKGAKPQLRTLMKIAWKTDISLSWLLTGKGEKQLNPHNAANPAILFRYPQIGEPRANYQLENEPFILVPRCMSQIVDNPNESVQLDHRVDLIAFKSSWITQEMGLEPKELALVTVRGDCMAPTINDGDLLLLDKRENSVGSDGIYVVQRNQDLVTKRLQKGFDGSLMIKNDNPAYETQTLSSEQTTILKIIGRVVWTGHRL
ncbi:MAG: helix-turn-helix transcriptional regulator [Magnetococcales bacterium]|nr:helix-turn-helix transcriptional regulator [Magnetococcales bacterium]